jgi:hypothetical protein
MVQGLVVTTARVVADRSPSRVTLADLTDAVFDDGAHGSRNGRGHSPLWISLDLKDGQGPSPPRFPGNFQWRMS